jgi:Putative lumazine-binding
VSDEEAIRAVVLDYFEGWYDGDSDRMRRALHPQLAKRRLADDGSSLKESSAAGMIEATEQGEGRRDDPEERRLEILVEHVYDTIASVTVMSVPYAEYVQLVRTSDGWKIANAVWQSR